MFSIRVVHPVDGIAVENKAARLIPVGNDDVDDDLAIEQRNREAFFEVLDEFHLDIFSRFQ